jgi:hypothetical protein
MGRQPIPNQDAGTSQVAVRARRSVHRLAQPAQNGACKTPTMVETLFADPFKHWRLAAGRPGSCYWLTEREAKLVLKHVYV